MPVERSRDEVLAARFEETLLQLTPENIPSGMDINTGGVKFDEAGRIVRKVYGNLFRVEEGSEEEKRLGRDPTNFITLFRLQTPSHSAQ